MATVVVMVWVTVWEVVAELVAREAAERRVRARMDLVCMVGGGWVDGCDVILAWYVWSVWRELYERPKMGVCVQARSDSSST